MSDSAESSKARAKLVSKRKTSLALCIPVENDLTRKRSHRVW